MIIVQNNQQQTEEQSSVIIVNQTQSTLSESSVKDTILITPQEQIQSEIISNVNIIENITSEKIDQIGNTTIIGVKDILPDSNAIDTKTIIEVPEVVQDCEIPIPTTIIEAGNEQFSQGDMYKHIYDPRKIQKDVFDMGNMIESANNKIFTLEERLKLQSIESDKTYRHNQNMPSTSWEITHNLNKYPSVTISDSAGTIVEGDIHYDNINKITITFSAGFSGFADLN